MSEKRPIAINHNTGTIFNNDNQPIRIGTQGGIRIGTGDSLPETGDNGELEPYKGFVRTNRATGVLQVCDGKIWRDILMEDVREDDLRLINSILF